VRPVETRLFSTNPQNHYLSLLLLIFTKVLAHDKSIMILDLFDNLVGYRTSLAKCSAFCCFLSEVVQKLQFLNNSIICKTVNLFGLVKKLFVHALHSLKITAVFIANIAVQ
jgi:hypothetical protein